jgi:glutathione S-transferase
MPIKRVPISIAKIVPGRADGCGHDARRRDPRQQTAVEETLRKPLGVLEAALAGGDYLLGEHFTAVDINVCLVLWHVTTLGKMDLSSWPNVSRWLAACTTRPTLARVFGR